MSDIRYINDRIRNKEYYTIDRPQLVESKIEFFNDITGERIWEPLHNKTVIAGSALVAMKLFNLNRSCLDNTPTYDVTMNLDEKATGSTYPTVVIKNDQGTVIGSAPDESQRIIQGFAVGQGGAGLDISDVFDVKYASWITPDDIVPFRYPLQSADDVDEDIYIGKKGLTLATGQLRNAYYFKRFANEPAMVQNYVSTIGTFSDEVSAESVYTNTASADNAQTYVELHLKITKDDIREFFIAHKGLENAKINQIQLVSGWNKTVSVTKLDKNGNTITKNYQYMQDIRPFSIVNIPNEIMSSADKSISIIYTLYF